MLPNQTICVRCGTVILKRTAEENHGQCIPCRRSKDGYEFFAKAGEWYREENGSTDVSCIISGTIDQIDLPAKQLAELIMPQAEAYIAQGKEHLDEFADRAKLGAKEWEATSIRFLAGGKSFSIDYEGPDYHHYLWSVEFLCETNTKECAFRQ